MFLIRQLSSNTESTAVFESTTRIADSVVTDDSCATRMDPAIVTTTTTTGDPSGADSSTIPSAEWTTQMLPESIHLVEGTVKREGDENRTASVDEDEEDGAAKTSAETKGANVIERNKAATRPFAISTERVAGDLDVVVPPNEKSSGNSTHTKVRGGGIIIRTFWRETI